MGEGKGEAPTLQEADTGSIGALPDRPPLQGRPPVPVAIQVPAPVWVLAG